MLAPRVSVPPASLYWLARVFCLLSTFFCPCRGAALSLFFPPLIFPLPRSFDRADFHSAGQGSVGFCSFCSGSILCQFFALRIRYSPGRREELMAWTRYG